MFIIHFIIIKNTVLLTDTQIKLFILLPHL